MNPHQQLSRRERQIMDALYAQDELSVNNLRDHLPDPPTPMAIRTMLRILLEKGLITRRKEGQAYLYRPKAQRQTVGRSAMQKVIQTFFDGSVEKALGAYFAARDVTLSQEQHEQLRQMIDQAKERGN